MAAHPLSGSCHTSPHHLRLGRLPLAKSSESWQMDHCKRHQRRSERNCLPTRPRPATPVPLLHPSRRKHPPLSRPRSRVVSRKRQIQLYAEPNCREQVNLAPRSVIHLPPVPHKVQVNPTEFKIKLIQHSVIPNSQLKLGSPG